MALSLIGDHCTPGIRAMNESLDRLESLFAAALQQPPTEQAAYLDHACAGDPALRQRVEALLRAQADAGSFLDNPVPQRLAEERGQLHPAGDTEGEAPASGNEVEDLNFL